MTDTTFVNLTPHTLNVHVEGGVQNFSPSGEVARCAVTYSPAGTLAGIPLFVASYGDVVGLPSPAPGQAYVVSGLVAAHPDVAGREDVFSPGELVRDESGRPCGCKGLKKA